jgi:hypothetical protein
MDDDALLAAAVEEAVPSLLELDLSGWAALMLYTCGEALVGVAWGMPDLEPPLGIDGDTMDELGALDGEGPALTALRDRVEDEDSWELTERFYLAAAMRGRALLGKPVLVYESALMPEEEQLARQGGRGGAPVADSLAGLDVILALRIDEHRVAAIWRDADGDILASGSVGHTDDTQAVFECVDIGSNPVVLAGRLPPGAVAVAGLEGELVSAGPYWLCVTGRRLLTREPSVSFVDADGEVFENAVPHDGMPRLWPVQASEAGRRTQWGDGIEVHSGGGWQVSVMEHGPWAPAAEEVAEELGVDAATVPVRPIAGTVLGHRHGFELAARDGVWAAVAECGAFSVTVTGQGDPPARLDLVAED